MWIFIKNIRSAFILFICFDISNSNKVRNFWDAIGKRIENERNRWLVYAISLLLDAILNLSSNFMFARAKILRCVFDVLGKLPSIDQLRFYFYSRLPADTLERDIKKLLCWNLKWTEDAELLTNFVISSRAFNAC